VASQPDVRLTSLRMCCSSANWLPIARPRVIKGMVVISEHATPQELFRHPSEGNSVPPCRPIRTARVVGDAGHRMPARWTTAATRLLVLQHVRICWPVTFRCMSWIGPERLITSRHRVGGYPHLPLSPRTASCFRSVRGALLNQLPCNGAQNNNRCNIEEHQVKDDAKDEIRLVVTPYRHCGAPSEGDTLHTGCAVCLQGDPSCPRTTKCPPPPGAGI